MKIVCCANGHFYDADFGKTCPCCGQAGLRHDRVLPAAVERLVDGGGFTWVKRGAESDVYRLGRKGDRALKLIDFGRVPDGPARAAHELKIMRRLRDAGFVGDRVQPSENGRLKFIYYHLLPPGEEYLRSLTALYRRFDRDISAMLADYTDQKEGL